MTLLKHVTIEPLLALFSVLMGHECNDHCCRGRKVTHALGGCYNLMHFSSQVCLAAVGLVGDLCRALQSNILPFCDEVMQLLLENLGVSELFKKESRLRKELEIREEMLCVKLGGSLMVENPWGKPLLSIIVGVLARYQQARSISKKRT